MARAAQGWATAAISALAVVAIAGGIMIAGGPAQGRAERRDDQRRVDLSEIENQLRCLSMEARAFVTDPTATESCPDIPQRADRQTGEAYRIEPIDDENLRLCATFETAPDRARGPFNREFDDQGCRVVNIPEAMYRDGG
ncbi:hypothetical protein MLD63_15475 [Paracoccus sp. TK19116]|uniref:Uncharacterized protein n=1 Tax=Paracoccus albicereus TaxID=2922394 RepID=A0ABT1MU58_9RHOB|nr:hypothetical protein [Paracoccus albicereus]MCQ0971822.1 hypothetical protein [Paracoccus albicereus]